MKHHRISGAATLLCGDFYMSNSALEKMAAHGGYARTRATTPAELAKQINGMPGVKILVTEYVPVDETVVSQAPGLKGVIAYGSGIDHIDAGALAHRGIRLCNCRGDNSQAVAELAFGMMLSLIRQLHRADCWVRAGNWPETKRQLPDWLYGTELFGKKLGIVGLGQIGTRIARIAKGFDMDLMGFDPLANWNRCQALGINRVSLSDLFSSADFVTLHIPLTLLTAKVAGEFLLGMAKPEMILVNTSRGGVVDESALVDALECGRIRGAAMDVFETEPLPDGHPLTQMNNVLLSPHIGALTREAGERLSQAVARQVAAIIADHAPENLISVTHQSSDTKETTQ